MDPAKGFIGPLRVHARACACGRVRRTTAHVARSTRGLMWKLGWLRVLAVPDLALRVFTAVKRSSVAWTLAWCQVWTAMLVCGRKVH